VIVLRQVAFGAENVLAFAMMCQQRGFKFSDQLDSGLARPEVGICDALSSDFVSM
jgi:hypothetical protein